MIPKKKQILSVIAAIVILAGGYVWAVKYQKTPATQPQNQTQQTFTKTGDVACLPHKGPGPTTQECALGLKADDGKYYGLIGSKTAGLGTMDGERVSITGILKDGTQNPFDKYDTVGIIEVQSIQVVSKTVSQDVTTNWKTYSNYGFEIKYPPNFDFKKNRPEFLAFELNGPKNCEKNAPDIGYCFDDQMTINIEASGGLTPAKWLESKRSQMKQEGTKSIAGYTALAAYPQDTEAYGVTYAFAHNSDIVEIFISSGLDTVLSDKILSTFKFAK